MAVWLRLCVCVCVSVSVSVCVWLCLCLCPCLRSCTCPPTLLLLFPFLRSALRLLQVHTGVTGFVYDADTDTPLPNVEISVEGIAKTGVVVVLWK